MGIVADFTGTETSAEYEQKLLDLGTALFGVEAMAGVVTRGDLRQLFLAVNEPTQHWLSSDTEQSFRPKLNWWNNSIA